MAMLKFKEPAEARVSDTIEIKDIEHLFPDNLVKFLHIYCVARS
jgi:hypothetical protein